MADPVSKKAPGTSSDVTPLAPERISEAEVMASLGDLIAARRYRAIGVLGAAGLDPADDAQIAASALPVADIGCRGAARSGRAVMGIGAFWRGRRGAPCLLVVARPVSPWLAAGLVRRLGRAACGIEICFCHYLVWMAGGHKNAAVDALNRAVNASPALRVAAYILDAEGRPRLVVGPTERQ